MEKYLTIVKRVNRMTPEKLYKEFRETDSIRAKSIYLKRLLDLRNKKFEAEIAKSENYPHEIEWDEFGDEMFELLALCQQQLGDVIFQTEMLFHESGSSEADVKRAKSGIDLPESEGLLKKIKNIFVKLFCEVKKEETL